MHLYIRNMVCNRCISAVKNVLDEVKLPYESVQLGEVALRASPTPEQEEALRQELQRLGFELLDDSRKRIIDRIRTIIIDLVHHGRGDGRYNLSELLTAQLHKDYSYLSHLFSEVEGTTIEKYFIHQKIERAKELLAYGELSLSEIAFQLGYSSVAHLSAQFKKVTGLTPTHFRNKGGTRRRTIDSI